MTERHKKFLNPEEAAAEIVKDLSSSEPEQVELFANEMEKFKCVQCGNCCLNLYDAFCTTADPEDLIRWEKEGRWDILDWVSFLLEDDRTLADLWINPRTGEEATRCPWLRKLPKKDKYKCQIHDTKPIHCKKYPKSKKHALKTGCKGFKDQN